MPAVGKTALMFFVRYVRPDFLYCLHTGVISLTGSDFVKS